MLAWAAGRAAAGGVRPAGALGPVEAFGADTLERACADAGFHRERTGQTAPFEYERSQRAIEKFDEYRARLKAAV